MKRKNERKLMNEAIRFGSACVLALGIAVTVQGARAASSDRAALSGDLEEAIQPTCVARDGDGESGDVESGTSTNILLIPRVPPYLKCCLPALTPGGRDECKSKVLAEDCVFAGGHPVSSCGCCGNACLAPTSDDVAEESEATAGSSVSSGLALMTIALLLLPVAPLARFRA